MKKTLYLLLLLLLASSTARPQGNNAVSISIIRGTCYSSKIADYCSDNNASMLKVILVNQDLREASIPVQLYMSVSLFGKETYLSTKSPNSSRIITLNSGSQLILTGKELDCIFSPQNLTGGYQNFKDGDNVIKIYARDIRTGKVVSNTASITLKSLVIAPPKLVEPDNGIVIETDNPFLLFSWKGDNGGGKIASKNNYVYRFYLWRQITGDPNVDAQVNRQPDYSFDNIKDERYQMPLMQYPFEIGKKYAWRVEARDPLGCATFINDGWSEARSFTYKHLPVPVTGLRHTTDLRTRKATVLWNSAEGHTKYYVEYHNPQTGATQTFEASETKIVLPPAPEQEYKVLVRVKAQCWNDDSRTSDWTPWDTIKYSARQRVESEYECGHKFPHVDITNFDLKTDFEEGDIVSEANGSSNYEIINYTADPDGTLRGQFYLVMDAWGGAKIACEFWDTKVNTDNVVITTRYRSIDLPGYVANPDEIQRYVKSLWLDANSVATSSKIRDTIVIKEKFDYLYTAADGTLYAVVVNSDGTTTETEVHTNKNTSQCLITDGQGDSLVISKNGQPMGIKEYRATGGNKALLKEYHRKSDSLAQWQINFTKYDAQTYAFDHIGSGNHGIFNTDLYYPKSGSYDFRYKSVESGKSDKVIVDFGSYPEKDSVIFKDKYGVKLKVVDGNILAFTGVSKADTNYIYAYRGDKKIGKLFLNTYQQKTYKVVLISVNEATLPNLTDLENDLNKVYNQCAVSFKIETRKLQVSGIENFTHGGTKVAGSVWNASQKAVLEAFGEKYEDNTAYLFFIPKAETGGVAGYMPRYYPYGFIYPGAANRTIAHELGHGIAGLEHPFPESQVSGNTANLMDYRDGTELWHFQWDMLQDPARKIFKWWQNEEGAEAFDLGANIVCITDEEIQKIKATQRYFFIADGRVVDLKDYNPSGFYTKDDKTESARGAVGKIRIDGIDYGVLYQIVDGKRVVSGFGYATYKETILRKLDVENLIVSESDKIALAKHFYPDINKCACSNPSPCELLKDKYKNSPLMNNKDFKYAIDKNPCILRGMVKFNPNMTKSEWMKEFDRFVESGLEVAAIPAVADIIVGPMIGEWAAASDLSAGEAVAQFSISASTELLCTLFATYIMSEKEEWMDEISWVDLISDVFQAGCQSLVSPSKYTIGTKMGLACLSNITLTDIYDKVSNGQWSKVVVDCGIGALFEWTMPKLMTWAKKVGPDKLLQQLRKKISFIDPIDEVTALSALGSRSAHWRDKIIQVLKTSEGIAAFNFLKDFNYNYLRLSYKNFQRLSNIIPAIENDFIAQKRLRQLFEQDFDANLFILSMHQLSNEKNTAEVINSVLDVFSKPYHYGGKKVTINGLSYTPEDFLKKFQDDNISYKYLSVDKGTIIVAKIFNGHQYCFEFIIDPITKLMTTKMSTLSTDHKLYPND